jgi:hypothetical protein
VELDDEADAGPAAAGPPGASRAAVHLHTLLCSPAAAGLAPTVRAQRGGRAAPAAPPSRLPRGGAPRRLAAEVKEAGPAPAWNVSGADGARVFLAENTGNGSAAAAGPPGLVLLGVAAEVRAPAVNFATFAGGSWPPRRVWIIYEAEARMLGWRKGRGGAPRGGGRRPEGERERVRERERVG